MLRLSRGWHRVVGMRCSEENVRNVSIVTFVNSFERMMYSRFKLSVVSSVQPEMCLEFMVIFLHVNMFDQEE